MEGGLEPSEADDSAEHAPPGATFPSEADAENGDRAYPAAESNWLEWTPPPCPECS